MSTQPRKKVNALQNKASGKIDELFPKCYFAITEATTPRKPTALAIVTPITKKKSGP